MKKKKFPINSKKSSILAQFNSIGRVSSEHRGEKQGSMFRWNKNTGYNFLSIHSQFKSLSYGARVHCQTTTDIIPERQYDRRFKDSALQRTIPTSVQLSLPARFRIMLKCDTFLYSDNALPPSPFFSSCWQEAGRRNVRCVEQYLLRESFERSRNVSPICIRCLKNN